MRKECVSFQETSEKGKYKSSINKVGCVFSFIVKEMQIIDYLGKKSFKLIISYTITILTKNWYSLPRNMTVSVKI
jgi:hypothetical protein